MEVKKFREEIAAIKKNTSLFDIYWSPDFQCDQTGGFPTCLCYSKAHNKAWLALATAFTYNEPNIEYYEQICADFGIKTCYDADDFNHILESLGDDAVGNAYIYEEDTEI